MSLFLKEHVDVRRVLVDREVDGPLPVRREGDSTIVPIVEEVLVMSKRFVLREEIHITRSVREEQHQRITLRRQEAEIERLDAGGRGVRIDPPAASAVKDRPVRPKRRSV
ncbi:MAG TPA: DUF2382 domain-containing protein [Bryobacteraceae bacterium]|nr:DUF2382 domain-containing protein [Bryobacteraceae bacterium]